MIPDTNLLQGFLDCKRYLTERECIRTCAVAGDQEKSVFVEAYDIQLLILYVAVLDGEIQAGRESGWVENREIFINAMQIYNDDIDV